MDTNIRNLYVRDPSRCLTPVYVPFESYSFVINSTELSSHPQFQLLDLQVYNAQTDALVAADFAQLSRAYPYISSPLFQIYCVFPFPVLPNGEYYFAIYDYSLDEIALRGGVITVERDVLNTTLRMEWWHETSLYGVLYEQISALLGGQFRQMMRLPLSRIDLQYESEKKTYRNITDRKLRTLQSFRDSNVRIEGHGFDASGLEALSAALEHEHLEIDGIPVQPKTALTINTNQAAALNKANFEGYASPELRNGIFGQYGDNIIICGNATFNPSSIIQP